MRRIVILSLLIAGCGPTSGQRSSGDPDDSSLPGNANIAIEVPSFDLVEGGPAINGVIYLKRTPTSDVSLYITSSDEQAGTVQPTTVTFTPQNWNAPQALSLAATDNDEVDGDRDWRVDFIVSGDDTSFIFNEVNPILLTTRDDDSFGQLLIETPDGVTVSETGSIEVEVSLSRQPDSEVAVFVSLDDDGQASLDSEGLEWSALDWNIKKTLRVAGIDDLMADGDRSVVLTFGPINSDDPLFDALPERTLSVVVTDGTCGNGVVDGEEDCEVSDESPTECAYGEPSCSICDDECRSLGNTSGFCGDGVIQSEHGEACDEPTRTCAYGEMSCEVCSPECDAVEGVVVGYCGDGIVQDASEACEPSLDRCCGETCQRDANLCTSQIGDACVRDDECVDGTCMSNTSTPGGYCSASCVGNSDCPAGSHCVRDADIQYCASTCTSDADCPREKYSCVNVDQDLAGSRECVSVGSGNGDVGDACQDVSECSGGVSALCANANGAFPDGFCSHQCDANDDRCPAGSVCSPRLGLCLPQCASTCRVGYTCSGFDYEGANVCVPSRFGSRSVGASCDADWDCSGGTGAYCLDDREGWPESGYCTQPCNSNLFSQNYDPCPSGAHCAGAINSGQCYSNCQSDSSCRSDFVCVDEIASFNLLETQDEECVPAP